MSKSKPNSQDEVQLLETIKTLAIQAMFSDDDLMEQLVLKGGNAMALVHRISARASVDLDFSLKQDFAGDIAAVEKRISSLLVETFRAHKLEVFDFKMVDQSKAISADMKHFWGGYAVEFKLVTAHVYSQYALDLEALRRNAINLGQGSKFLIDISRFEYVDDKQPFEFDGYIIYVYSPEMIVCEKLRAICQQLPEYGPIIKRSRPGSARARDFVDIFVLVSTLNLDLTTERTQVILTSMFAVKKVPIKFLSLIPSAREFHHAGFSSVEATVSPGFELKHFDFYFEYTLALVARLEFLWDK